MIETPQPAPLVEHFFRHEYGRLVAVLSRQVGVEHLEQVEDAVQSALAAALETWPVRGQPDDPGAWLFRVAQNQLRSELRTASRRQGILERHPMDEVEDASPPETHLRGEVGDGLLRMLLVCCDPALPVESQLVLALKTLCGFDVREIALRLFRTEANIYKRLSRARARLREAPLELEGIPEIEQRRPAVHAVLYTMFTEGHLSSHPDAALRRELCDEAIRLAGVLAAHESNNEAAPTPETCALLALMHLHAARAGAREDASGGLLLLEEQDRRLFDAAQIHAGLSWLERSARGETFSRYHAEAGIAAEHCLAASFEETRWDQVVEGYASLIAVSPVHRLNHAVALAQWKGPAAALAALEGFEPPTWLAGSYQWSAVLADLHHRAGGLEQAARHRAVAVELAPTDAIRALLARRLAWLEGQPSSG